jgi:hypothetical protein
MNPEPFPLNLPTEASVDRVIYEHLDLEKEEVLAVRDLRAIQEDRQEIQDRINNDLQELQNLWHSQQDIQDRLEHIGRQKEHWTLCLQREEERVRLERIAAWQDKEKWEEGQKDWLSKQVDIRVAAYIAGLWDKDQLVGNFVQVEYGGAKVKGVVTERVTRNTFTILYSDGSFHTVDIRYFIIIFPTDTEREVFRGLGHPVTKEPPAVTRNNL